MLRTDILAPESGLVVNLKHFTPGGVLKPGEPFLDIVPQHDTLVVECKVEPTDIDAVKQGLAAEVRLSAYKQRRTPTLHGRVLKVSADALTDEKLNKTYYAAEVAIDPDQLAAVPDVKLYPGMPADVMIMTGKRTALQYLVDPIRDSFWRSFREK
jgi:HlyD family type I secretion membrane fusion protein